MSPATGSVPNYAEANTVHYVTTATSPTNLATVAGAGTYNNGDTAAISAPASITNAPNLYTFRQFQLNGALAGNNPAFNKTFSTLDPTNMQYVAVYDTQSILPLVVKVTAGFTNAVLGGFTIVTNPVPASSNYQITLQFDRTMNTNVTPLVLITNSSAPVQASVPANGAWFATALSNDTYRTPFITFSSGMDGPAFVQVSGATDPSGGQMTATNVAALVIDVTPPPNPVISLVASNSSSALVSWSGYSPPSDLGSFRLYLNTNTFSSVAGMTPLTSVGSGDQKLLVHRSGAGPAILRGGGGGGSGRQQLAVGVHVVLHSPQRGAAARPGAGWPPLVRRRPSFPGIVMTPASCWALPGSSFTTARAISLP